MQRQVSRTGEPASAAHSDSWRDVLIDMLSPACAFDAARAARLGEDDWVRLDTAARQHRLRPMLHHLATQAEPNWPVPDAISQDWRGAYHRSARRSLALEQALFRACRCLDAANIPYAALKGATIAWTVYPHPALRPMRDLDLLVARDRALEAYQALLADGLEVAPGFSTPPAYSLEHDKHFAPIYDRQRRVSIELHFRCTNALPHAGGSSALHDSEALLDRSQMIVLRGKAIRILSPTDTLLHLIVHAVYDHKFDIGPTVLADLAQLLRSTAIDWDSFWRMADAAGWGRSCQLCLALVARTHGALPIDYDGPDRPTVPEALISEALDLMLSDTDGLREVYVALEREDVRSLRQRASFYWGRVFPPRHVVARWAGVTADHALPAHIYVQRLLELARAQLRWQRTAHAETSATAGRLSRIIQWIAPAPPG